MADKRRSLRDIYRRLYRFYGPQHWWPGDSALEVIVGAVLTQNTAWSNVEKAIGNLKDAGLLSVRRLKEIDTRALARCIRPSGYYNIKARRLKNVIGFLSARYGGDIRKMRAVKEARALREELLSVKGIGEETADSMLLYALGKTTFVVDAYTKRIFSRHGFFDEDSPYGEVQAFFASNLPEERRLFNEFHALIVRLGKEACRKKPRCGSCPLHKFYCKYGKEIL